MTSEPVPISRRPRRRASSALRRERILAAVADLVAERGYRAVAMADFGAAVGVTAPAIYRHFDSKAALLEALFDQVIDRLLSHAGEIVESATDDQVALSRLVAEQVDFAVDERKMVAVYVQEVHNIPGEDRRRLRRKQRLYVEEWVHLMRELLPDLSEAEARTRVHAAIAAVQSVHNFDSALRRGELDSVLTEAAHAVVGVPAASR